eukprot:365847-Chlamydomonas_euryale.AAC.33
MEQVAAFARHQLPMHASHVDRRWGGARVHATLGQAAEGDARAAARVPAADGTCVPHRDVLQLLAHPPQQARLRHVHTAVRARSIVILDGAGGAVAGIWGRPPAGRNRSNAIGGSVGTNAWSTCNAAAVANTARLCLCGALAFLHGVRRSGRHNCVVRLHVTACCNTLDLRLRLRLHLLPLVLLVVMLLLPECKWKWEHHRADQVQSRKHARGGNKADRACAAPRTVAGAATPCAGLSRAGACSDACNTIAHARCAIGVCVQTWQGCSRPRAFRSAVRRGCTRGLRRKRAAAPELLARQRPHPCTVRPRGGHHVGRQVQRADEPG